MQYIINDLNLDINQGEFIGIAGPSGCGKSSLIKVISKLEEASGDIKIDGIDIDSLSRRDIAKEIALVPQSPFLISASIKDNICYGINRKVTMEEVREACKKAFIDDFIEKVFLINMKPWYQKVEEIYLEDNVKELRLLEYF